jgi:preprotein translocase subunit SecF
MIEMIKPGTQIDFVGWRRFWAIFSFVAVIFGLSLFIFKGPRWSIEFTGGTEVQLDFDSAIEIGEFRDSLETLGISSDSIQQVGKDEDGVYVVRIQDPTFGTEALRQQVESALKAKFGDTWIQDVVFDAQVGARMTIRYAGDRVKVEDVAAAVASVPNASVQDAPDDNTVYVKLGGLASEIERTIRGSLTGHEFKVTAVNSVGPKVGGDLRTKGIFSIAITILLIVVYIAFRFELAYAPGAILCLVHDVALTVGVFIVLDKEFNTSFIAALLTIIGYSLNDTIVIYDRIRENSRRYRRKDLGQLINDSINETLTRTISTSLVTVLAMLAFLFEGGQVIQDFALAITLGVFFGTYSTIYVATPTVLLLQEYKPLLDKWFGFAKVAPEVATAGAGAAGGRRRRESAEPELGADGEEP